MWVLKFDNHSEEKVSILLNWTSAAYQSSLPGFGEEGKTSVDAVPRGKLAVPQVRNSG